MLQVSVNNKKGLSLSYENGSWMVEGEQAGCDIQFQPGGLVSILYNNKSYTATVDKVDFKAKELLIRINGMPYNISVREPMDQLLESMGMDMKALQKAEPVKAPMPGMILKVLVEPGQKISKGDGLLVLEAMKMENILKASADAVVRSVNVKERTAVEKGAILIEME